MNADQFHELVLRGHIKELFTRIRGLEIDLKSYEKGTEILKSEDAQHIKKIEQLEKILFSYRTQARAAMKAQSLGLCKKVISHAFTDEKKILEKK